MEPQIERRQRALTESDVTALVEKLEQRLMSAAGRGFVSFVATCALRAVVLVAVYGAGSAGLFKKILGI
jgi:hypothetical protein